MTGPTPLLNHINKGNFIIHHFTYDSNNKKFILTLTKEGILCPNSFEPTEHTFNIDYTLNETNIAEYKQYIEASNVQEGEQKDTQGDTILDYNDKYGLKIFSKKKIHFKASLEFINPKFNTNFCIDYFYRFIQILKNDYPEFYTDDELLTKFMNVSWFVFRKTYIHTFENNFTENFWNNQYNPSINNQSINKFIIDWDNIAIPTISLKRNKKKHRSIKKTRSSVSKTTKQKTEFIRYQTYQTEKHNLPELNPELNNFETNSFADVLYYLINEGNFVKFRPTTQDYVFNNNEHKICKIKDMGAYHKLEWSLIEDLTKENSSLNPKNQDFIYFNYIPLKSKKTEYTKEIYKPSYETIDIEDDDDDDDDDGDFIVEENEEEKERPKDKTDIVIDAISSGSSNIGKDLDAYSNLNELDPVPN